MTMTLKEKLEALVRGEKLGSNMWRKNEYIHVVDDKLIGENGTIQEFYQKAIEYATHIYQPPALNLGPEHVGKLVQLYNKEIHLILGFVPVSAFPIICNNTRYDIKGKTAFGIKDNNIEEVIGE
jgi:hypothetical protein